MDLLASMQQLIEVVDSGSFSAAGRRLGLAPSSVARAIAGLEDELGVRLLNRSTRKLSLTEPGRLYLERTRRIVAEIEDANRSISQLEAAPRGLLRLNAPQSFGRLHIVPALPDFFAAYPEIRLDLSLTDAFVDLVEEGVDLAVRIGELQDSSLIARKLAPNRRVICASPAYVERHGRPSEPQALQAHNCLIYKRQAHRTAWWLRDPAGATHEVEVQGSLQTNNADALRAAVLGGLGIGILPTWLVGRDVHRGRLEVIFPEFTVSPTALDTNIYAVFPFNGHLSPKVRAMVDFLAARFGPRPYWECGAASAAGMAAA
jgi:DNA-binding transcriptional LysR family regulator